VAAAVVDHFETHRPGPASFPAISLQISQLTRDPEVAIGELAPYVKTSGARLVVFNSCESVEVANLVMQEAGVDVIATICPLEDTVAVRTANLFARNLLRTGDFRQAYEMSRPGGNRVYVYLNHYEGRPMTTPNTPAWMGANSAAPVPSAAGSSLSNNDRLLAMMERTQQDVSRLVTEVEVLKSRLAGMEKDVVDIKAATMHQAQPTWQSYLIVLIGIAVFVVMGLVLAMGGIR
jgi:hypothetical protein